LDERRKRAADIARVLELAEPRVVKLQAQLSEMEMNVKKARAKQKENERYMREAQAKLSAAQERLRENASGGAGANPVVGRVQPTLSSV
jgi:chromosome segregation ATPase